MSITKSKRIPILKFWQFVGRRTHEEIFILIGLGVDESRTRSNDHWDNVPEPLQEKIYNFMVTL